MKLFMMRLIRTYFGFGAVAGGFGILSYVWGLVTQPNCGDFVLAVGTMAYAVFAAIVRSLLWLPSLIHWWMTGSQVSFMQWLMPGLSMACGTSP